jgi:uncharacterized protein
MSAPVTDQLSDDERIIDTNVYLSRWPFRRLAYDETSKLVERLKSSGISQAWAGSFDGLLHKDVGGVNLRLYEECKTLGEGLLRPVGSINPALPDWQEDVRRCAEDYQMHAIRLHPGYHDYTLSDPRFEQLLDQALHYRLIVQIAVRMEDVRTQHPLMRIPDVDVSPLTGLLVPRPDQLVMLLNSQQVVRASLLGAMAALPGVYVDMAMQEGMGGLSNLLKEFPQDRVVFGSYAPFFILESSLLKLQESEIGNQISRAIRCENATRLDAGRP